MFLLVGVAANAQDFHPRIVGLTGTPEQVKKVRTYQQRQKDRAESMEDSVA